MWSWRSWPWTSNNPIRSVRSVSAPSVWTRRINNIKNIAVPVAVVAGGVWGFWVYVNPDSLRPRDYQAHLSLAAEIELVRVSIDRTVVRLNLSIVNPSRTTIRTVGGFYEVRGLSFDNPSKSEETAILGDLVKALNQEDRDQEDRDHERNPIHLFPHAYAKRISAGRVVPDQMLFASGEEYSYSIVTLVPCTIDVAQVAANVFYHKTRPRRGEKFDIVWTSSDGQLWATHTIDGTSVEAGTQGINWSDTVREMAVPRDASAGDPNTNRCASSPTDTLRRK